MNIIQKYIIALSIAIFTCTFVQSQNSADNQLALLYYSKSEFEKAIPLYEKLYKESKSHIHFEYLAKSYIGLKNYSKAIEVTEIECKKNPRELFYHILLAYVYELSNNKIEADKIHENIIKKKLKTTIDYISAIDIYLDLKNIDKALEILEIAEKKFPESSEYGIKQIELLCKINEFEKATQKSILLLNKDEDILSQIQQRLLIVFNPSAQTESRKKCLQIIEEQSIKFASKIAIQELLFWAYIQEKEFKRAYRIAKALHTKLDEDGNRIFELGMVSLSNNQYETAKECFSLIIEEGSNNIYYEVAIKHLLETNYNAIITNKQPNIETIVALEDKYKKALSELRNNSISISLTQQLAYLQAFYLQKPAEAIALLDSVETFADISSEELSKTLYDKANIYLYTNEIWTANLLFAKVALEFKNLDNGNLARLKQAKIAYYNGQFDYAEALLDVLKASTTKYIANDAFELWHLIAENSAEDTTTDALLLFAQADLLEFQSKPERAIKLLDSLKITYSQSNLNDDVIIRKAQLAKTMKNYALMEKEALEIIEKYSYDIYADNAHYLLADYYETVTLEKEKAKEHYKKIVLTYPDSYYCSIAREKYRLLEKE